jgi:hypothetical protein
VAAARAASYLYMWGSLVGLGVLAIVLGILGLIFWGVGSDYPTDERVATAVGCAVAGALGACASVSWRVTAGVLLNIDPGAGVPALRRLGVLRPFIGAIFGLAIYFALRSNFVNIGESNQNFYFFAFFAFVAGFSERVIPDLLHSAEERLGGPTQGAAPSAVASTGHVPLQ